MVKTASILNTTNSKINLKYTSNVTFKGKSINLAKYEDVLSAKIPKLGEDTKIALIHSLGKISSKDELLTVAKGVKELGEKVNDLLTDGIPVAGFFRIARGIIKGDAKVTAKGAAAIIDNTIVVPVKTLVTEIMSNIVAKLGAVVGSAFAPGVGTATGTAVGKAAGYTATLTIWGKLRNKIVDEVFEMLKPEPGHGGAPRSATLSQISENIWDTMGLNIDMSNYTKEQFFKSAGMKKSLEKLHLQQQEQAEHSKIMQEIQLEQPSLLKRLFGRFSLQQYYSQQYYFKHY